MEERRQKPRQRSLLGARIYYNNRQCTLDCTVRNVSEDGALLKFADIGTCPSDILLTLPSRGEARPGHVVWRTADRAGVALGPAVAASETPDQVRRVRRLEQAARDLRNRLDAVSF